MPTTTIGNDVFIIYDELKRRVLGISDVTAPPAGFLFSFLPAGRPVDPDDYSHPWVPNFAAGDQGAANASIKSQQSLMNLSALVDHKLQLNGTGQAEPGASLISDTWKVILDSATAKPMPPVNDPVLRDSLERAGKLLMKPDPEEPDNLIPTNSYLNYQKYMRAYNKAVQAYTAQYIAAMANPETVVTWPVIGTTYKAEVDSAMDDWISLGKKNSIEDALNLLSAQGTDAATAMIASSKKLFTRYQVAATGAIAATVPYVHLYPTNWCDLTNNDGWTEFTHDSRKSTSTTTSDSTAWGGRAGVRVGFWSFGAGASHSNSHEHSDFEMDELVIRFRYAVIDIDRPWMNTVLLNLQNWFMPGFKKNAISNGTVNQQRPDANEAFWLPAIPTQIIVVKDLFIKTTDIKRVYDFAKSHTEAGGSIGIGPFSIGGHYENDSTKKMNSFAFENEGISIKGAQIIGWVSQILPASPKMDG